MPTHTTRRKPVRVPPPPVRQPAGRRQASPKVLLIAGGAVVAVVLAIVLALSLGGGSAGTKSVTGAADVQSLFKGITQEGNTLGSPDAPVTMVEYVDLQCPYCREFETTVLPKLLPDVRSGKLRIEQRLLAFIGPDSVRGRDAALAAGLQNKQFGFTELLYFNQGTENTGWLDQSMVNGAAAAVPGLNVDELGSADVSAKAAALDAQAAADNVSSTPTILVGKTGGALTQVALASPSDLQSVTEAIQGALAR